MSSCFQQKLGVLREASEAESRDTSLSRPEQLTRSAQGEILLGDNETVRGPDHCVEPPPAVFADAAMRDEQAMCVAAAASNATA